MALQVPPQFHVPIRSLLELPEERLQAILEALKQSGSKFNVYDLASDVTSQTGISRQITDGVIQALAYFYLAKERQALALEAFLDEQVGPGLKNVLVAQADKAAAKEEIEARWTRFRKFLVASLALDDTIGTAAKAGPVMTEHERVFVDARILTDVRPIFHPDLSEKPSVAVVVHMLRITTRDIFRNYQAQYFALDSNDIRLMKQLMDRAITKEETLTNVMGDSGLHVITPKGIF
jgi:hypothetical protein